ncbi:MAG: hypothetical protein ABH845_06175 [Candidatus Omnitrophota bacterium]
MRRRGKNFLQGDIFRLQVMLGQIDSAVRRIKENDGAVNVWFAVASDFWFGKLKSLAGRMKDDCVEKKEAEIILSEKQYVSPEGVYVKVIHLNELKEDGVLRRWNLTALGFETVGGPGKYPVFPGLGYVSHGPDCATLLFQGETSLKSFRHACFLNYITKASRDIEIVPVPGMIISVDNTGSGEWRCPECGENVLIEGGKDFWERMAKDYVGEMMGLLARRE